MKCGTTSLFYYLAQHPQLIPSATKEVHFFDGRVSLENDTWALGLPWYRAHFPLKISMGDGKKAFEASPSYLFHPWAPERIHATLPNVKLIALLRNPAKRAVSHYLHERRKGRETLPLMQR